MVAVTLLVGCNKESEEVKGINITGTTNLTGWVAIVFGDPSAPALAVQDGLAEIDVSETNIIRTSTALLLSATWLLERRELPGPDAPPDVKAIRRNGRGSYTGPPTVTYNYVFVGTANEFAEAEDLEKIVGPIANEVREKIRAGRPG